MTRWRQRTDTRLIIFPRGRHDFTISQVSDGDFLSSHLRRRFPPSVSKQTDQYGSAAWARQPGGQRRARARRTAAGRPRSARIGGEPSGRRGHDRDRGRGQGSAGRTHAAFCIVESHDHRPDLVCGTDPIRQRKGLGADYPSRARHLDSRHRRTAAIGYLAGLNYLLALRVRQAGADVELIRYKGVTAIWTDLLGGRIHAGVEPLSSDLPQIQAGKLKAIATFGSSRSALIPDVATVREQGYPEIEGEAWNALLTRAGTPPAVIDRLNREVVRILALPEVQERLRGVEIKTSDPQSVARMIREDTIRWAKVIRDFDVKPDN